MGHNGTDLRVIRTKQAINNALSDMILEMEYPSITVKELVQRAMINRNTFYLHYASLDALLDELQDKIAEELISMRIPHTHIDDIPQAVRRFFEYAASRSPLMERLLCCDSYRFLAEGIHQRIAAHQKQALQGMPGMIEACEDIVFAYYGSAAVIMFRQWVANGKLLTLEELISLATTLICSGINGLTNR